MDLALVIPFMPALLITLTITTTYNLPSSMHGNHDIDKSILFIAFFGVVMLNVALILASPFGDNNPVLDLACLVTAFLQVAQICLLQRTRLTAKFKKTRNLLVFIAGINLAIWFQSNFILNNLNLSNKDVDEAFKFFGTYG